MSGKGRSRPDWLAGLKATYKAAPQHVDVDVHHEGNAEKRGLLAAGGLAISARNQSPQAPNPTSFRVQLFAECKEFLFGTKLNLLLFAIPLAICSRLLGWGDGPDFVFSMLGLMPLAERLGFITEQLAMYTNDTLGGLLNASFGNATELIISAFALRKGYLRIVQLSLLGSVISNLQLVLGSAFIAGGIKNPKQSFNQQGISVNCTLLLLGTMAVLLPSLLSETHTQASTTSNRSELSLSRFESVFLLLCYGCYLLFQLYTHRHLYQEPEPHPKSSPPPHDQHHHHEMELIITHRPEPSSPSQCPLPGISASKEEEGGRHSASMGGGLRRSKSTELIARRGSDGRSLSGRPKGSTGVALLQHCEEPGPSVGGGASHKNEEGRGKRGGQGGAEVEVNGTHGRGHSEVEHEEGQRGWEEEEEQEGEEENDDDEELVLSKLGCFSWLSIVTVIIAILSEWIMDAIKGASKSLKVPMPFLVTIVLPIVGNAAEHASAIVFAYKNKMEIALGVAVGSSTQVAVLVIPFTVILAWCMGQPLDLNFNSFEAAVYFLSVLMASITVMDGNSNWLKGVLLLVTYVLVAAGFWMHQDSDLALENVDAA